MKKFCDDSNFGFGFVSNSWVSLAKKHILGVVISILICGFPTTMLLEKAMKSKTMKIIKAS